MSYRNLLPLALTATFLAILPSCKTIGGLSGDDPTGVPLPSRDQAASFFGPGSEMVDRDRFPFVPFAGTSSVPASSEIKKLAPVAEFMKQNTSARLILAGFCDEDVTDEYARSLGERRALSVRAALSDMGVSPDRIHTVSYGEDFPSGNRVQIGLIK